MGYLFFWPPTSRTIQLGPLLAWPVLNQNDKALNDKTTRFIQQRWLWSTALDLHTLKFSRFFSPRLSSKTFEIIRISKRGFACYRYFGSDPGYCCSQDYRSVGGVTLSGLRLQPRYDGVTVTRVTVAANTDVVLAATREYLSILTYVSKMLLMVICFVWTLCLFGYEIFCIVVA